MESLACFMWHLSAHDLPNAQRLGVSRALPPEVRLRGPPAALRTWGALPASAVDRADYRSHRDTNYASTGSPLLPSLALIWFNPNNLTPLYGVSANHECMSFCPFLISRSLFGHD